MDFRKSIEVWWICYSSFYLTESSPSLWSFNIYGVNIMGSGWNLKKKRYAIYWSLESKVGLEPRKTLHVCSAIKFIFQYLIFHFSIFRKGTRSHGRHSMWWVSQIQGVYTHGALYMLLSRKFKFRFILFIVLHLLAWWSVCNKLFICFCRKMCNSWWTQAWMPIDFMVKTHPKYDFEWRLLSTKNY